MLVRTMTCLIHSHRPAFPLGVRSQHVVCERRASSRPLAFRSEHPIADGFILWARLITPIALIIAPTRLFW
jgi:hypothetical protein